MRSKVSDFDGIIAIFYRFTEDSSTMTCVVLTRPWTRRRLGPVWLPGVSTRSSCPLLTMQPASTERKRWGPSTNLSTPSLLRHCQPRSGSVGTEAGWGSNLPLFSQKVELQVMKRSAFTLLAGIWHQDITATKCESDDSWAVEGWKAPHAFRAHLWVRRGRPIVKIRSGQTPGNYGSRSQNLKSLFWSCIDYWIKWRRSITSCRDENLTLLVFYSRIS